MGDYIVSARKYRPISFNDVVGQPSVTSTLKNAIRTGQIAHAYLFCGPRGVGKTTCARILARTLNCYNPTGSVEACGTCESCKSFDESRSYNIHELDAASNNSVDDIRTLIEKVRVLPQIGKYSIYIIDEVHMLSQSAFNAFLKTLEEPPSHAIFILATTEKHKILPTILSRCQVFDFNRIRVEDIITYLKKIADGERIQYEKEALHVIAVKAEGALRDALSIFDQAASFTGNNITYKEIIENLNVLDSEYYFKLTEAFINNSTAEALLIYNEILQKGFDGYNFIGGLSGHLRDLLVSQDTETIQLLEAGDSMKNKYVKQASVCNTGFLFQALEICSQCEVNYKSSKNQRLHVELALIRMCKLDAEKKNPDHKNDRIVIPESKSDETNIVKHGVQPASAYSPNESKPTVFESINKYKVPGNNISIKEALRSKDSESKEIGPQNDQPGKKVPESHEAVGTAKVISEEFLNMCWIAYADQIRKPRPRMAVALKNTQPIISSGIIKVVFSNQSQLEYFNESTKAELEEFLQREMQNPGIQIEPEIRETTGEDKAKLYTNDEKFSYLNKKNPLLSKLKEDLNLEIE